MTAVLHGGLTQPKMLAAMDVKCADTTTSAGQRNRAFRHEAYPAAMRPVVAQAGPEPRR